MEIKQTPVSPPRALTKAECTTKVAKSLIDNETAKRNKKTKLLRAARLEKEALEQKGRSR